MKHFYARLLIKKHWAAVSLAILCSFFALLLVEDKAQLIVEMTSSGENRIQIFWATEKLGYAAKRSISKKTAAGKRNYYFSINQLSKLRKMRLDPQSESRGKAPKSVIIHSIRLRNKGIKDIVFQSSHSFASLIPSVDISSLEYESGKGLKLFFDGSDPQLEFNVKKETDWNIVLIPGLILILLHWFLSSSTNKGSKKIAISYVQLRKKTSVPVFDDLINLLNEKKIFIRHLYFSETEHDMTAHFLLTLPNAKSFFAAINEFQHKENLIRSGFTFHRSGEIN